MSSLPLQPECNMDDPEEHFLWALVGLPGPDSVSPMLLPPQDMRRWSKRLWDCGFRHQPDLQKISYSPPAADHNWLLGPAGNWQAIDEPKPELNAPSLDGLTVGDKWALYEALKAELEQAEPAEGDFAEVIEDD